ncbi:MAG: UDP-3-O-(3-hydroxymyristoyl)glucosamine N-acyltransferase [Pirellulaceae bacterium]
MDVHSTSTTLGNLALFVGGRVVGSPQTLLNQALPLQDAEAGCLTLVDASQSPERIEQSPASAVLVGQELSGCTKPQLVADDPHAAFAAIILHLRGTRRVDAKVTGISAAAHIDASAVIGAGTAIAAGSSVGAGCEIGLRCTLHPGVHVMADCRIGDDCELFPGVVLYPDTRLGNRVIVHSHATLGAAGFGYKTRDGRHHLSAQLGWVEVGDDVEIGASTAIDRGTYGPTKIGHGSKLDNLVQIAHNCQIGAHNLICAHVGIAGSCSTGDYVVMAGQAGMADHIHLGNRVVVGGQAGVMQNVPDGQTVFGSPAIDSKRKMQEVAVAGRLPQMRRDLKELHKQLQDLREQLAALNSIDQQRERHVA